jgi:hypothetical protein
VQTANRHTFRKIEKELPMKIQLKKLAEQVIVITGASSGIGLGTARNQDALPCMQNEFMHQDLDPSEDGHRRARG